MESEMVRVRVRVRGKGSAKLRNPLSSSVFFSSCSQLGVTGSFLEPDWEDKLQPGVCCSVFEDVDLFPEKA
jgi:hypothetical protein